MKTPESDFSRPSGHWIQALFDRIAGRYDLLNDLFSLGIHRLWKRSAIAALGAAPEAVVLDAATGTGDLAIRLAEKGANVTAVDFSEGMLALARKRATTAAISGSLRFLHADILKLPFEDHSFDAAVISFGVRNFSDPEKGILELWRVIRPGGRFVILEFGGWMNLRGFSAFMKKGASFLKADPEAYLHLIESSSTFPSGVSFIHRFLKPLPGLRVVRARKLFFGIAHLYVTEKTN